MATFKKNIFKLCIFGFLAFTFLISSVSAEQVDVGYVTSNTEVLMDIPSSGSGAPINLPVNTANSYGNIFQLWINVGNLSITPNYIYQLELRTPNANLTNITTLQVLANNGQICNPLGFTDLTNGYPKIYFSCKSAASYISIYLYNNTGSTSPITTAQNFRWNYAYLRYFTEDTDIDLGPVISNQQQNTQQIIDNQNQLLGNCFTNYFPLTYSVTNGSSNGITRTINSDKTITLSGTATQSFFIGLANIGQQYFGGDLTDGNCRNGYCLYLAGGGGGYTYSNGNIWYYIYGGQTYNVTLKPMITKDKVYSTYTPPGTKKCISKLDDVTGAIGGVTDSITDDDIGSSTSDASNFITNFNTNTFGLTSIVTAPLTLIQSLTSSTCSDLELPLPFLDNKKLTLPCMTTIYSTYFGSFFTIYQTITYGIIAYWVIVRIFNQVKDFKNPEHDEIEVVDL